MALRIETVSARAKLQPRREPYWHRVKRGVFIGFRKTDSGGTWIGRLRLSSGKQAFEALGTLEDHPAHLRFDVATASLTEWLQRSASQRGPREVRTVRDACDQYAAHLRDNKGEQTAADSEARYRRWVFSNQISDIDLHKLTREDCREFKRHLVSSPVIKRKDGVKTERSKDTVNRDMTALRAALNFAYAEGNVTTDFAWRETLKPFEKAGRRRELYLDRTQREKLIANSPPDLALLLRALCAVPLRPGAIAALPVGNFEPRLLELKVGKDKHGKDRKLTLGHRVGEVFASACSSKSAGQMIFEQSNGAPWNKDAWKHPIKKAAASAGLPPETTAYTLRHSIVTDLVHDGLDLLTVAQISGTSVAMIERHYGHHRGAIAAAALERVAVL